MTAATLHQSRRNMPSATTVPTAAHPQRLLGLALTFSRVPLLVIATIFLVRGEVGVPLADVFDGLVFNSAPAVSTIDIDRRHVFDAIGDRVLINSLFLVAIAQGYLGASAYVPVLARELILASVVVLPFWRFGQVLPANLPSKIATVLIAAHFLESVNGLPMNWLTLVPFAVFSIFGVMLYRQAWANR